MIAGPRYLLFMAVSAAGFLCPPAQGSNSARAATIHPSLVERCATLLPGDSLAVWVCFRDRFFADPAERLAALADAQESIGARALARRSLAGCAVADDHDLPVTRSYRDAVAAFGRIRHESRWLNAVSMMTEARSVEAIGSLPFVAEVRPVLRGRSGGVGPERSADGRLLGRVDPSRVERRATAKRGEVGDLDFDRDLDYGPSQAQLEEIGVPAAHEIGYTGARVVLMMLDTGFSKVHDAFAESRLLAERDFVFGDDDTQNEQEDDPNQDWHGTATWSAAGGFSPGNLAGPGFGATFLLAKTEDVRSETPVEEDHYVAALEWGDSLGVMVTSASLIYRGFDGGGGWSWEDLDGDTAPITRAIDRAAARGILCVNAMGNYGPDPGSLGEPADADTMLACGAVSSENSIASFSSRGPTVDGRTKPEVVARGVDTWCAFAGDSDLYGDASGTSLATPLVGGACALVMEAHPEWSAFEVRQALMATADRAGQPDNAYGHGRIDVWAAIHHAPIVVPLPFSLAAPADGDSLGNIRPRLVWGGSRDPQGGEIRYEVWIDEEPDFATPLVYADLPDTLLDLPVSLAMGTRYHWRVIAEEPGGYSRLCRDDRSFRTPGATDAGDLAARLSGWRLVAAPNPTEEEPRVRFYAPPGSYRREVRVSVFDPLGRRLTRDRLTIEREGWNEIGLPLYDAGGPVSAGVFVVELQSEGSSVRTKIVIMR